MLEEVPQERTAETILGDIAPSSLPASSVLGAAPSERETSLTDVDARHGWVCVRVVSQHLCVPADFRLKIDHVDPVCSPRLCVEQTVALLTQAEIVLSKRSVCLFLREASSQEDVWPEPDAVLSHVFLTRVLKSVGEPDSRVLATQIDEHLGKVSTPVWRPLPDLFERCSVRVEFHGVDPPNMFSAVG